MRSFIITEGYISLDYFISPKLRKKFFGFKLMHPIFKAFLRRNNFRSFHLTDFKGQILQQSLYHNALGHRSSNYIGVKTITVMASACYHQKFVLEWLDKCFISKSFIYKHNAII
jgi:hypothetical protein